jgi:hypothetical protein
MVTFKNDYRLVKKYDGKTISGLIMVSQEEYGLSKSSNWFGGNMTKTAIVKDKGVFLALNNSMKTVGVGYHDESLLDDEDREIFGLELRKPMLNEEVSEEEIDEEKQNVLTPSNEVVKIVNNKGVSENTIKRKIK